MTARSRPPTDQQRTAIYDPERQGRRPGVEMGTPTEVSPPRFEASRASPERARSEPSEPIRVISLKGPPSEERRAMQGPASEERRAVQAHQPRLRRLSEVSPQRRHTATPPGGLGYLAPPRDPREVATRRRREYLRWGSVVVILAVAVMLGVWFLAGR